MDPWLVLGAGEDTYEWNCGDEELLMTEFEGESMQVGVIEKVHNILGSGHLFQTVFLFP